MKHISLNYQPQYMNEFCPLLLSSEGRKIHKCAISKHVTIMQCKSSSKWGLLSFDAIHVNLSWLKYDLRNKWFKDISFGQDPLKAFTRHLPLNQPQHLTAKSIHHQYREWRHFINADSLSLDSIFSLS